MTSSQAVSSFMPPAGRQPGDQQHQQHQHQQQRPGRPKVAREPRSEAEQRRADLIATRKAAMSPIKAQLAKMGKTQAWLIGQLAQRAHLSISPQTISNYLNGHAGIAEDTLVWVCIICGVNVQEILASVPDRTVLLQAVKRPLRYQRHKQPEATATGGGQQPQPQQQQATNKSRHVDA